MIRLSSHFQRSESDGTGMPQGHKTTEIGFLLYQEFR
jgi:hypothetical protein